MWQRMFAVLTFVASSALGFASVTTAKAEQRLALVIGNSAYEKNQPLSNPQNDAQAVAQLLNTAGFEVVMAFDLSRDVMKQTIEEFAARVGEKGSDSAALVYYAGHGLQVDGENYLVPVDARLEKEEDLAQHGVKLADVMGALQTVQSKIRIVILDACRNNPFQSSGVGGKGLAIVDAPAGTIVAYSTAPGTEALDGSGKHSPFAAAFMRIVKQPDLPIEQVFKKVRRLVNDATDNRQTPWESSSLTADFVFFSSVAGQPAAGGNASAANAPGGSIPGAAPSGGRASGGGGSGVPANARIERVTVADLGSRPAIQAYDTVIEEDSVEYYEEFIRLFPADPLAVHVRRKLALRKEMLEWQNVTYRNTPEAYANFASRFNDGAMFIAARKLQDRPRPIEIALPRRGDPRLNTGDFGQFRVNIARGTTLISFPRGQQNNQGSNFNRGRDPVIPFQRGQNQNSNQNSNQSQNQNQNQNQNQKQNSNQNTDRGNNANNRGRDNPRNAREGRGRESNIRNANRGRDNFRNQRFNNRAVNARPQNVQRAQSFRSAPRQQNFRAAQNFRPAPSFRGGGGGGGGFRRR